MILEDQLRELAQHLEMGQSSITVEEALGRASSSSAGELGAGAGPSHLDDDVDSIEDVPSYLDSLVPRRAVEATAEGLVPRSQPATGRRRSILVAAAAAVVLAVIGGSLLLTGGDTVTPDIAASPDPIVAPETPLSEAKLTAERFLDAWSAFDADRAIGYLADQALIELWGGPEALRLEVAMLEALGVRQTVTGCDPAGESVEGTRLLCGPEFSSATRIQGGGPHLDISWDLTVGDGLIVSVERGGPFVQVSEGIWELWEPFSRWMRAAHPLEIPLMFDGLGWRLDEESIRLWELRTREFLSSDVGRIARGVGLLGLPPEGATPSTPETGELVVHMYSHASGGADFWLFVYADGRVIWSDYTKATPTPDESATSGSVGFLERRLTPEGVDLLLAEVLSTGLFDPDQPPSDRGPTMEALNGDQLVAASQRPGIDMLRRMRELESWLAPEAWADQEAKFYVPARYAACLANQELPGSTDPSGLLSVLPAPAAGLLVDAPHWAVEPWLVTGRPEDVAWPSGGDDSSEFPDHCFELTTDEANALVEALETAGAEPHGGPGLFGYKLQIAGSSPTSVDVGFTPYMPHGEVECACYG